MSTGAQLEQVSSIVKEESFVSANETLLKNEKGILKSLENTELQKQEEEKEYKKYKEEELVEEEENVFDFDDYSSSCENSTYNRESEDDSTTQQESNSSSEYSIDKPGSQASSLYEEEVQSKNLSISSSVYEEGASINTDDENSRDPTSFEKKTEKSDSKDVHIDTESRASNNESLNFDFTSTENSVIDHSSETLSDNEEKSGEKDEVNEEKYSVPISPISQLVTQVKEDQSATPISDILQPENQDSAHELTSDVQQSSKESREKYKTNRPSSIIVPINTDSMQDIQLEEDEVKDEETNLSKSNLFSSVLSDDTDFDSVSVKSGFSSVSSLHQVELTKNPNNSVKDVEDERGATDNRMSVASLGENPDLNDISLDDETITQEEESVGWSFPKNLQTPVKSLTSFISSFSLPSTPTVEHHQNGNEEVDSQNDINYPKTPNSGRSFTSLFSLRSGISSTSTMNDPDLRRFSNASLISQNSNYDLLLAKIDKENEILTANPRARRMSMQGMEEIKKSFERVQHNIFEKQVDDGIDWDFWGQIISDYETVAKSQPRQLSRMIQKGIPSALRGMIWQLMSKSKDAELESTYAQLLKETSIHEKLIMRDLNRTFPKHEYFQDQNGIGQEGLFNVVKAYSLFDKDVGYCQGISFVVGPLLLQMPDEEAFCVLVRLMTFYNMRGHFLPGMDGLQLRLFQFDRLVEEMLPKLHQHLQAQGIDSSMYASQWFMTLFAYKFPLSLVLRIYDAIFTEGLEALFRFSIALLKRNEDRLVHMEFETLLEFLKSGLYTSYQINDLPTKSGTKETEYNTNEFVQDAYSIRITIKRLNKYQQQFLAYQEAERQARAAETIAMERLRLSNNQLSHQVKNLEGSLQTLNREHIDIANELINTKIELAKIKDENDSLHHTVNDLRRSLTNAPIEIENRVREEMNTLASKNFELVTKNTQLEDQLSNIESMLIEIKMRYAESENEREVLRRKWNDLKKALG
ncbi:hypothetical protein G9A89_004079 [Geosiphon pyriformis]|nr:hypothetical protein G9A89_004079 [Geosiphon pyriformis]